MRSTSSARQASPARPASAPARPGLRVLPGGRNSAPKAPFVVLVLVVLGAGLIGLLALNTGLQHGSFEIRDLEREARVLRDRHEVLTQDVARVSAPGELARSATELGMVPGTEGREYLDLEGGSDRAVHAP